MNQKQFWLINQMQPNSTAYNIPTVFIIAGPLKISALEQGINEIIRRHEIFRTSFTNKDGNFTRETAETRPIRLQIADISNLSASEQTKEQNHLIDNEIGKRFDLSSGPLIRAQVIVLDREKHVLLIVMHHIITDLHAKRLFATELSAFYNSLSTGTPLATLDQPVQYDNHLRWQQKWSNSGQAKAMMEFWQKELKGRNNLLNLPLDHPRPAVFTGNGAAHDFTLTAELTIKLLEFSRQRSIDIFVTLLSGYVLLLARYSNQDDITIGVPLTNRRRDDDKKTMACFVNILPLTFTLNDTSTFDIVLRQVRIQLLSAHRNQEAPFNAIVEAVQPERDPSYNPIFQAGFTVEPPMELQFDNVEVKSLKRHNMGAQLDVFLNFWSLTPEIQGYFEYNTDLFDSSTIERLYSHYRNLLQSAVDSPHREISQLDILSQTEKQKLLKQWNDTNADYGPSLCLHELFENQVEKSPEALALVAENAQLTYRRLNEKANQLAHYLISQGIGPEDQVGIFMDRSLEMVIAIYGIIKAGAAYVPLDPEFPEQRIAFILTETRAKALLTQDHLLSKLPSYSRKPLCLDTEWQRITPFPRTKPENHVAPQNLAYVIYTSGSTGTPKGVMNEHRGIHNRLLWMQDAFQLSEHDSVMQKTPFSFDVSVWEFFWPLCFGARLVVAPPGAHKDPTKLSQLIKQHAITTIHFVPSMLRLFLESGDADSCHCLKRVICSGEALSWELQTSFFNHLGCELHNLYGPTEAAVDVTHWTCNRKTENNTVPIGYPIANTQIYILNRHLRPVPQGTVGELYIGGIQVARGYIKRPELNDKKFIRDPFSGTPDGRLYKTGDLGRYLPNGAIEYLGRVDFQIKLHGNRIELGEIESALCRHPQINGAVVIMNTTVTGKQQLVAYLITSAPDIKELALRKYLINFLPSYMIPGQYIALEKFPLTSSGKIDRKMLPEPDEQIDHQLSPRPPLGSATLSRQIASIWSRLLEEPEIGIHDNFFDVGGNSLLATQLAIEIEKEFKTDIQVVKIFHYPTIDSFSDFLRQNLSSHKPKSKIRQRAQLQQQVLAKRRKR